MPKIDVTKIPVDIVNRYPDPFWQPVEGRERRRLGNVVGLSQFGVNLTTLKPGAWSSQRHWHNGEDEFLVMLEGEAVLVEDDGRTLLRRGDVAVWPKGTTNGHHLRNESDADCAFIVIGGGTNTGGGYSDIDLIFTPEGTYAHKDGTPYEDAERPA